MGVVSTKRDDRTDPEIRTQGGWTVGVSSTTPTVVTSRPYSGDTLRPHLSDDMTSGLDSPSGARSLPVYRTSC